MQFIISLVSFEVIGICVLFFLSSKKEEKYSLSEFFSLAFLIGIGIASIILFVLSLAGLSFTLSNICISIFALVFVSFLICVARRGTDFQLIKLESPKSLKFIEMFFLGAIVVQIIWLILMVIPMPVNSHDAVANFALKAKMFHFANGIPAGFFQFPEEVVAHPDYPMLLPLAMTWIYEFTGFNDLVINMIMPCFFVAFLVLFYSLMLKLFNRAYALLLTFVLATIPQVGNYATILYADLLFAVYLSVSFAYLFLYFKRQEVRFCLLSVLMLGFAVLTKNEAIVFVAAYALVIILRAVKEKDVRLPHAIGGIALFALICVPWYYVKATSSIGNSDIDFAALSFSRVMQNVSGLPEFFDLFQQQIFGPKKWNIFWIMLITAMIWRRKKLLTGNNFYLTVFFSITVLGYFAAYMVTTGENLYFYANTTLSRFMIHFAPVALLLMAVISKDDVYELESFK